MTDIQKPRPVADADPQAEIRLLGSLLTGEATVYDVAGLRPKYFSSPLAEQVFSTIKTAAENGAGMSFPDFCGSLNGWGEDGYAYVLRCGCADALNPEEARHTATYIAELWARRSLHSMHAYAIQEASQRRLTARENIELTYRKLESLAAEVL